MSNSLGSTQYRHMKERMYSSSFLNFDSSWRCVMSIRPRSLYLNEGAFSPFVCDAVSASELWIKTNFTILGTELSGSVSSPALYRLSYPGFSNFVSLPTFLGYLLYRILKLTEHCASFCILNYFLFAIDLITMSVAKIYIASNDMISE